MKSSKTSTQNGELLSALVDGELLPKELSALHGVCDQDPAVPVNWNAYHVIGEALRSPGSTAQPADFAFLMRLQQELVKAPLLGTVTEASFVHSIRAPVSDAGHRRGSASNDSHFRWKLVAGFASATAFLAIAWSVNGLTLPAAGSQLAQLGAVAGGGTTQQVVIASPQGLMVRDARLEELLSAHKQLGATSALPVPSGFLRHATFEMPENFDR